MKPVTVEDYEKYGKEFFEKYDYVAKCIKNEDAESVLKVMEALAATVMQKRKEDNKVPLGFNKNAEEKGDE